MSDDITRLKKFRPATKIIPFGTNNSITLNDDDSTEQLAIIIDDREPQQNKQGKFLERRYFIRINSQNIMPVVFASGEVVPKTNAAGNLTDAQYAFNIGYEAFTEGKNDLVFYEDKADAALPQFGSLTVSRTKNQPGQSDKIVQPDGSVIHLLILGNIAFNALPDKNQVDVKLQRPGIDDTPDKILWKAIKNHSLNFDDYENFIDIIICRDVPGGGSQAFDRNGAKIRSPFIKSEEYNLIKFATDFYMLKKFGLSETELFGYVGSSGKLPYYDFVIKRIRDDLKFDSLAANYEGGNDCDVREEERLFNPFMIELIWSYWMEQGMLVQAMNVINLRFQNIRTDPYSDRLQRFDADPLRPLSYILWGYIQDEQHRLALPRRVNEYDHEYGLKLTGRAVQKFNPADSRVKFLEAFHNLLNLAFIYFKESDDTTYIADAFPVLNALREVHLLLAEGNHNAYGNLTWTARQEMMMQQYILARPEMREFLGGRTMVPYPEGWMDRIDSMRNIMGWGTTSILHFYELAFHGEQLLLSIRYGNWSDVNLDRANAANWAQEFRNNIYRYTHAYRVVTGVDLTMDKLQSTSTYALQPAYLMQQRLLEEKPGFFSQQQQLLYGRNRKAS
ncbi:MAG: hypothetical protein JO072_13185 [Parafilimonas sp.]|nr:hypothetical protein [Parafilimonas sp.]